MTRSLTQKRFHPSIVPRQPIRREPHPERSYVGDDYRKIDRSSIDVIVSDKTPRTGLIDQDGNDLYRLPPERPPGFTSKWSDES